MDLGKLLGCDLPLAMNALASYIQYDSNWSLILLIIGVCSIIAFTVFLERIMSFRKAEGNKNKFIMTLRKEIKEGNIAEAIRVCDNTKGAVANIIKAGLNKHERSQERIETAMEVQGMIEIASLEKNTKILSIIAHIAPLIGLLGTVLGFIQAFSEMRLTGLVDISTTNIGEALEYALVTTAAGLVVAIPSVVAYNYLVSRIEGFVLEIQATSSEVVDILLNNEKSLKA